MSSISSCVALTTVLALTAALPATAAGRTYTLTPESTIKYDGTHPAHRWTGVSHAVAGTITLDADGTTTTPITVCLPVRSFDSGNRNRDSNALTYLEAGKFPKVCIRIDTVTVLKKPTGGTTQQGQARVSGVLTFHGVTRPVSLLLNGQLTGNKLTADGQFPVLLSEFQVKRPELLFVPIDDAITVSVHLNAIAR